MKNNKVLPLYLLIFALSGATAQPASTVTDGPNGTQVVVAGNEGARAFHTRWGYAPAVRAGDYIVMAGVIAGPAPDDGKDAAAFKRSLRGTFTHLAEQLQAVDATLEDVVRINSYHVWNSDYFEGDKMAHMEAVREVKNEFITKATPAWTAIGVSELFTDSGLVEIELTVYAPQAR
ncbi:MAG: Rid family hydrolase [Pseudomonadota bacterium]